MPAFGSSLKPQELDALVAFLQSRKRPIDRKINRRWHPSKSSSDRLRILAVAALLLMTPEIAVVIGCYPIRNDPEFHSFLWAQNKSA